MPPLLRTSWDKLPNILRPRAPTTTTPQPASLHHRVPNTLSQHAEALAPRQQINGVNDIIPTYYVTNGPSAGTVVGITLGSVAGFLLIVWLLFALSTGGSGWIESSRDEVIVRRDTRSPRSRRSRHSTRGTETREVVREYSRSPRRSTVIVDDRPPPRRSRSVHVEERFETRVPGDDIVEVIEEGSDLTPPPRRKGRARRNSGYRY